MELQISDLLTTAGLSAAVTLIMSVLLGALAWPPATVDRFGPLLAVAVGLVLGTAAALIVAAPIPQALLTGLLAGCASQGIHQVVKAVGKGSASGPSLTLAAPLATNLVHVLPAVGSADHPHEIDADCWCRPVVAEESATQKVIRHHRVAPAT